MSLIPGADNEKVVCKDGIQVDHLSENTVGHGVRVRGISDGSAVVAGDVGEVLSGTVVGGNITSPTPNAWYDDSGSLVLTAGKYMIIGDVGEVIATTATGSGAYSPRMQIAIKNVTDSVYSTITPTAVCSTVYGGTVVYGSAKAIWFVSISASKTYCLSMRHKQSTADTYGAIALSAANCALYAVRIA